jgi:hypothetical protein
LTNKHSNNGYFVTVTRREGAQEQRVIIVNRLGIAFLSLFRTGSEAKAKQK